MIRALLPDRTISSDTFHTGYCLQTHSFTTVKHISLITQFCSMVLLICFRPLRAALNLAVIKQLVVAVVNKISLSRNLVKMIDISTVIQNEAAGNQGNKIVVTINALAEMVNQCQWDENHACISQNDKDHLIRLVTTFCYIGLLEIYLKQSTKHFFRNIINYFSYFLIIIIYTYI